MLGSIWASIEIIVGNFMHSFKIPFTGEILTFFAIYFLTAASVRWKMQGLIWRSGLICAMMKLFTPGIKIFGPIIGILSESFVMDAVLRVFGLNIIGFILAGGLTLCVPLLQKIINLLILYGWNLVVVFDKSIEFLFKLLNISNSETYIALILLFSVNFFFGFLASLLGYTSQRKSIISQDAAAGDFSLMPSVNSETDTSGINIIILKLVLHTSAIIALLVLFKEYFLIAALFSIIYLSFNLITCKKARRILSNYKLWLQILVFTTLTAMVLSYVMKSGLEKSLYSALEMFLRVLIITSGFSVISTEIGKPAFMSFLYRRFNRNFSEALNLAFAAVPEIIKNSPGITSILRPGKFISHLTSLMDEWHNKFVSLYK